GVQTCALPIFSHGEMPLPVPPPLTMGHEASGTIAAVGTEVPGWREGDRVAVMGGKPCLQCRNCVAGLIEDCQDAQIMGVHYDGAWAEEVVGPWYVVAPLPEHVVFAQ